MRFDASRLAHRSKLAEQLPQAFAWAHVLQGQVAVDLCEVSKHGINAGMIDLAEICNLLHDRRAAVRAARDRALAYRRVRGDRAALLRALGDFGYGGKVLCSVLAPYNADVPPLRFHLRVEIDDAGAITALPFATFH